MNKRNSLKRIDDSFKKIIIVKDNIVPRYDEYGIYYIGIKKIYLWIIFLNYKIIQFEKQCKL